MIIRLLLACLLLLATPALAQQTGPKQISLENNLKVQVLCDAQSATGVCTRGGNQIVVEDDSLIYWFFESVRSTATTYSCDAFIALGGYHATQRTQVTGLTLTQGITSTGKWVELPLASIWWECTTITGGTVTIHTRSTVGDG